MLVIKTGIHKMLVRIANTRLFLQNLPDLDLHYLSRSFFSRQLVFKILEHLPYVILEAIK